MKIHLEYNGAVFVFEHRPMPEGRFRALCCLAAGGVLAVMVHMVGSAAIVGSVVALTLVGIYKAMAETFK